MTEFPPDPSADLGAITVLHVDDEPAFASMVREMISERGDGITVETERGADAALDRLATGAVDCVVSDHQMPDRDGLDLLREVRDRHGDLPFILFTGKGSEEIASEAISAGVDDYIQKRGSPDQFDILVNRIENAVEKRRAEREIRHLKRKYERIAESTADALWDWEIEYDGEQFGGTVHRSSGYARSFGYEEAEIETDIDWWVDRIHPEDRRDAVRTLESVVIEGETYYEDSYRFRRADGTYTSVLSRGYVEYEDGDPTWMVGSIIDRGRETVR